MKAAMRPGNKFGKQDRKVGIPPLAAWSGILGPLVILLGIIISAGIYTGIQGQSYHPLNHFVSELGEAGVSRGAPLFNLGLILGGLFNAIFLVYLPLQFQGWVRYPLLVLGPSASLLGLLVGLFPMNDLDKHIFVALGFFNLGQLVALFYSLVILFSKSHPFPRWLGLPGLFCTASFLAFNTYPSDIKGEVDFQAGMAGLLASRPDFIPLALLEWVLILSLMVWFLALGIYLAWKAQRA